MGDAPHVASGMSGNLYRFQKQAIQRGLKRRARYGYFMEMGTGKTRVAIETASQLPRCRRIVVVLPLAAAGVWRREVRKWAPAARSSTCTRSNIRRRAMRVKQIRERSPRRRIYMLVGYESFWREPLKRQILRFAPDMMIYDEAHRLKSWRTRQSKFAHSLATPDNKIHTPEHVLALTGTPMPNGPQDAFSIFKAIDPSIFGTRWTEFESRYIIKGGYLGYQIVGYQHEEELRDKIAAHSFRITKAEALDLPPQVDVVVPVELSRKARRIYDKLAKTAIAQVEGVQGKGTALGRIVLANEMRLQQVASGFVRVEEEKKLIDFDTAKRDALAELLEDVILQSGRAVVFCRFTHDVDEAIEVANKIVGEHVVQIDGRVDQRTREAQCKWFNTFEPSVLVGQIQVASLAIDLSVAHVCIFYSRNWSLLDYDQARSRLHRHGQRHKVTYYHLIARDTIDEKIQRGLAKKQDMQATLLRDKRRAREFFDSR